MCIAVNLAWPHTICAGVVIQAMRIHILHFRLSFSCHHFLFVSQCIWHLSGGLRVMPWSCLKVGHCSMFAVRCPTLENSIILPIWKKCSSQGSLFWPLVRPITNKGCLSCCCSDVTIKTWNESPSVFENTTNVSFAEPCAVRAMLSCWSLL